MKFTRASGILLHPTSLPGRYGIGDLGDGAYKFVEFLAAAGQTYWQILPLGPTGYGDSPYQCFSAFAGNTLMISPDKLVEHNLLTDSELADRPRFTEERADFGGVYEWKNRILPLAYRRFMSAGVDLRTRFETFKRENHFWLDDYALYRSVKIDQYQKPWYEWPDEIKLRDPRAISEVRDRLHEAIQEQKFYQFVFFSQWAALRKFAGELGVKIIGDIPIFVALDSADVWCNQDKFKLNKDGSAKSVAGVPPDYFSKTGQLWGNPIYDWNAMSKDGFRWWVARVYSTLQTVDIARIDHFRGFAAAWEVPGEDETAENGKWVEVPGRELFTAMQKSLGELPLIAEDLGHITPDVEALRDDFGFPGMRILQFAFGGDAKNHDLPHNYVKNCVAYTGTHDNDTVVGWFDSRVKDTAGANAEIDHCLKYLDTDGKEISWDFIRAVWASVADIAVTPMADLLGLGSEGRMNLPSSTNGNWHWRMPPDAASERLALRLRELTVLYGRVRQ